MAIIEGLDDDVTLLLSLFIIGVVICLAWISTNVREPLLEIFIIDGSRIGNLIQRLQDRQPRQTQTGPQQSQQGGQTASQTDSASDLQDENPVVAVPAGNDAGTVSASAGQDSSPVSEGVEIIGDHGEGTGAEHRSHDVDGRTDRNSGHDNTENTARGSPEQNVVEDEVGASTCNVQELESIDTENVQDTSTVSQTQVENDGLGTDNTQDTSKVSQTELRQRRVNFYNRRQPDQGVSTGTEQVDDGEVLQEEGQFRNDSTTTAAPSAESNDTQTTDNTAQYTQENLPEGHIRVRLKYLDDRQRLVHANPIDTIGQFKRNHFASELAENLMVRFIYNGQELDQEATLESYNVVDNSVIHCLLSSQAQDGATHVRHDQAELDIGRWMFPLFGLILMLVWYCRIMYRNYFSPTSTLSLIGITFFYFMALLATMRRDEQVQH